MTAGFIRLKSDLPSLTMPPYKRVTVVLFKFSFTAVMMIGERNNLKLWIREISTGMLSLKVSLKLTIMGESTLCSQEMLFWGSLRPVAFISKMKKLFKLLNRLNQSTWIHFPKEYSIIQERLLKITKISKNLLPGFPNKMSKIILKFLNQSKQYLWILKIHKKRRLLPKVMAKLFGQFKILQMDLITLTSKEWTITCRMVAEIK